MVAPAAGDPMSPPQFPVSLMSFVDLGERIQRSCAERRLHAPAFRSPPTDRDLRRSIQRGDGQAIVSVRIAQREYSEVAQDMVEGAAVVLAQNGEWVTAVLREVLDRPPPPPDRGAIDPTEEPF